MQKVSTIFLQAVIVVLGMLSLVIMIRFPLTEGRAVNLDLFSIYTDPVILYGYVASVAFFVALYQVFKLLGHIGQNKVFSLSSVKTLRTIKYCALILSILIVAAVLYIGMSHNTDDDPVGFMAIGILATFISVAITTAAAVFERILQSAVAIKSERALRI